MRRRVLEKDVKKRLRDIHDLRIELGDAGGLSRLSGLSPGIAPQRVKPIAFVAIPIAIIAIAVAVWALTRPAPSAAPARLTRLSIARPENPGSSGPGTFAIAPDGSAVVFSLAKETGEGYLWIRDLDDPVGRIIQGTENAAFPFWSPDSRHVAFFADGKLKRVPRSGGTVQRVCDAANGRGGAWSPAGTIVFAPNPYSSLLKVSADGSVPEAATTLDTKSDESSHRFPCFLPDGRHFTYGVLPEVQPNLRPVFVASLDDPVGKRLLLSRAAPRYAPPGYLIFAHDQAVVAQRIDLETLTMVGDVVQLVDRAGGRRRRHGRAECGLRAGRHDRLRRNRSLPHRRRLFRKGRPTCQDVAPPLRSRRGSGAVPPRRPNGDARLQQCGKRALDRRSVRHDGRAGHPIGPGVQRHLVDA